MEETPNFNYVEKLSGGDKEFEDHLIGIIKEEFPLEVETYFQNMEAANLQAAAENVHKIKHKISILGLERGYELADVYEEELKEENTRLTEKFNRILELMGNFLNQT